MCPSYDELPAISAVIHDEQLFGALVRCLNSAGTLSGDGSSSNGADTVQQGRKRTLSFSGEMPANKALKLTHSPKPGRKPMMENRKNSHRTPAFKLPVLAATILYTACAHLDHWPAPFMEAYAADCFGPRKWVDDEDCATFVENLALVHKDSADEHLLDQAEMKHAELVAEVYKGYSLEQSSDTYLEPPGLAQRRPSISSVASQVTSPPKNSSDSDSGGEECIINRISNKRVKDGDSSSSGEEEDTDIAMSGSNDGESRDGSRRKDAPRHSASNGSSGDQEKSFKKLYPVVQSQLKLDRVRARYFGLNLDSAVDAVSKALVDRIGQKSKQNSGLLQALPAFTSIPKVRALITGNLEKWLQSPALAGLSRSLFSVTVEKMKNIDPPLAEDLRAIDSILAMKLKANQFAAHVENVTAIANRIPTASVANHMYSQLLRNALRDSTQGPSHDSLSMVAAIHSTLPPQISYEALAASLLMMLASGDVTATTSESKRLERMRLLRRLRKLIRMLSSKIGAGFDGFQLLEAFLALDVSDETWSVKDEEDKARLMFQCVTLYIASVAGIKNSSKVSNLKTLLKSPNVEESVRKALRRSRRMLLTWCCTDYGPSYCRRRKKKLDDADILNGTAGPDFSSAIGPDSQEESIPPWLNTMRCLLMIEDVDSELMKHFLSPSDASGRLEDDWVDEAERIALCANFGADVDDEMIGVILKSASFDDGGLSSDMAIKLLENLFESCGKRKGSSLEVSDPDLVWEMYKLAQYTPSEALLAQFHNQDEENDISSESGELPRLAFTGLWWRVTILGLVMCGSNPEKVGAVVWKDHPTLSALIKMVTSAKYRFPTVDCDDGLREKMKQEEQAARDEESRVAELLFLPPKKKASDLKKAGSRMSKRLLKQHQEKVAAAELAETHRRKKLLRSAQKKIMLWDPDGPARKPPRESAELLVSAAALFGLSDAFQRCTGPDFLLNTIGGTSRSAIERAYDWLIPVISRLPATISRLPSSTSCFLLLRAYGTDGERRAQLKELSAPLLDHVKASLGGTFGEGESTEAFDILLSDVASHNSERRKSSRRVLSDALRAMNDTSESTQANWSAWMVNILQVKHARAVVPIAMSRMSTAAKYERGRVLKSIVMALQAHTTFAEAHDIAVGHHFPVLLSLLVSQRPNVYAEAIDSFPDFRSLVIRVISDELGVGRDQSNVGEVGTSYVQIKLKREDDRVEEKTVPAALLQTTCILLSVWSGSGQGDGKDGKLIEELVDMLMLKTDDNISSSSSAKCSFGLASAVFVVNNDMAMTVDSVREYSSLCETFEMYALNLNSYCDIFLCTVDHALQGTQR
jgi:integrator complex subunit 1